MATLIAVSFSQSDPRLYPSLAPTFLTFKNALTGVDIAKPAVSSTMVGTGIYSFLYHASVATYFLLDGITTASTDRYVFGVIDPFHQVDNQLAIYSTTFSAVSTTLVALGSSNMALGTTGVALGTSAIAIGNSNIALGMTSVAIGTSAIALGNTILASSAGGATILALIGDTASAIGSTSVDPTTLFGFLKRNQEFLEGDQTFSKTSGVWSISSRGGTLLVSKTLSNSSTQVTKD